MTLPQPAEQRIPLPQIADRVESLDRLLREINSQLRPKWELLEAERKAEAEANEIRQRVLETRELLAGTPTPLELEDEQRYWSSRSLEYSAQRKLRTTHAAELEEQIQLLEAQQPQWQVTWDQVHNASGIEPVAIRIRQALDALQATRSQAQEQLNLIVTLQNRISQHDQQISDVLARLRQVREQERRRILEPDSRPLWEPRELRQSDQVARPQLLDSFDRSFTSAKEFLRARKLATSGLLAVYCLVLIGIYKLRGYAARATTVKTSSEASQVLDYPFSVALLITLLGMREYVASAPIGIAFAFYLLYLIPVLRILVPLIDARLRILLYVLSLFYVLEGLNLLIQVPTSIRRDLFILIALSALVSLGWLARPSRMRPIMMQGRIRRIPLIGIRVSLGLLAASLVANISGFFSLAQVLGLTALVGPFVAAALYCGLRVLNSILSTILRTPRSQELLATRAQAIERWGGHLVAVGAALLWLKAMLQLSTVYDSVMGVVCTLLRYPIGSARIHFTLGDALGLIVILIGGYAVANALTFLLKNLLLPSLPLQRGVPYAISTITYYVLLVLVALAALSSAGVELNKFTVLTGAIGVGLGFGLQNIVNNFVSGLILLCERPIHVGDTVEVGGLVGIVRRIGARSSTVVTFQGGEVILPNSNLLSNQLINWTLSSPWRRVDIPVRVAYGTDPEHVIKLLVALAESHPGVLLARPPTAFFMGFGESAQNFELRFWSDSQDTWFQLQSDMTVAVAKAFREAGIEIPFPQRDVHIRATSATAADTPAREGMLRTAHSVI